MKKFLSLCVAATVAAFGFVSCSGGGDNGSGSPLTVKGFKSGSRQIVFNAASQIRVYSRGDSLEDAPDQGETRCDVHGYLATAASSYSVEVIYEVTMDEESGAITAGSLNITFDNYTLEDINEDTALLADLGVRVNGDDDENGDNAAAEALAQAPIVFEIDYTSWTARSTVGVFNPNNNADGENDPEANRNNNFNVYVRPR